MANIADFFYSGNCCEKCYCEGNECTYKYLCYLIEYGGHFELAYLL